MPKSDFESCAESARSTERYVPKATVEFPEFPLAERI